MAKERLRKYYDGTAIEFNVRQILNNKYYNIFMNLIQIDGMDHDTLDYTLKKLYHNGTICAFNLKNYGAVVSDYAPMNFGLYGLPNQLSLINTYNVPNFPKTATSGVDCVIGYLKRGHEPIERVVKFYVDKLAQLYMSLYINIETSKLPFIIGTSVDDKDAINEFIAKLYSNDLAIFMPSEYINQIKVLNTGGAYIVDKIWAQILNTESELLTQLGIDANALNLNRITADQSNANNALINNYREGFKYELTAFCDKCNEILGTNWHAHIVGEEVLSIHEEESFEEDKGDEE